MGIAVARISGLIIFSGNTEVLVIWKRSEVDEGIECALHAKVCCAQRQLISIRKDPYILLIAFVSKKHMYLAFGSDT